MAGSSSSIVGAAHLAWVGEVHGRANAARAAITSRQAQSATGESGASLPFSTVCFGAAGSRGFRMLFIRQPEARIVSPWHDVPLYDPACRLHLVCTAPAGSHLRHELATDEDYTPLRCCSQPAITRSTSAGGGNDCRSIRAAGSGAGLSFQAGCPWNVGSLPQTRQDPEESFDGLPEFVGSGEPIQAIDLSAREVDLGTVYSIKPVAAFAVEVASSRGSRGSRSSSGGRRSTGSSSSRGGSGGDPRRRFSWRVVGVAGDDPVAPHVGGPEDVEKYFPGALGRIRAWLEEGESAAGGRSLKVLHDGALGPDAAHMAVAHANATWQLLVDQEVPAQPWTPPSDVCAPVLEAIWRSKYDLEDQSKCQEQQQRQKRQGKGEGGDEVPTLSLPRFASPPHSQSAPTAAAATGAEAASLSGGPEEIKHHTPVVGRLSGLFRSKSGRFANVRLAGSDKEKEKCPVPKAHIGGHHHHPNSHSHHSSDGSDYPPCHRSSWGGARLYSGNSGNSNSNSNSNSGNSNSGSSNSNSNNSSSCTSSSTAFSPEGSATGISTEIPPRPCSSSGNGSINSSSIIGGSSHQTVRRVMVHRATASLDLMEGGGSGGRLSSAAAAADAAAAKAMMAQHTRHCSIDNVFHTMRTGVGSPSPLQSRSPSPHSQHHRQQQHHQQQQRSNMQRTSPLRWGSCPTTSGRPGSPSIMGAASGTLATGGRSRHSRTPSGSAGGPALPYPLLGSPSPLHRVGASGGILKKPSLERMGSLIVFHDDLVGKKMEAQDVEEDEEDDDEEECRIPFRRSCSETAHRSSHSYDFSAVMQTFASPGEAEPALCRSSSVRCSIARRVRFNEEVDLVLLEEISPRGKHEGKGNGGGGLGGRDESPGEGGEEEAVEVAALHLPIALEEDGQGTAVASPRHMMSQYT